MKKLIALLALTLVAVACVPQLPPKPIEVNLPSVALPVVAEEDALWQTQDVSGKPVLVVFMGSWCPWCKKTMPAVDALFAKHAGKLEVVAVFMDETPGPVRDAVKEHQFHTKALYNGQDLAGELGVNGLPHTILFDTKHHQVAQWEGYRPDLEEQVTLEIEKL